MKICPICNINQTATIHAPYCSACLKEYNRQYRYKKNKEKYGPDWEPRQKAPEGYRYCSYCKLCLTKDCFYPTHKNNPNKLGWTCKDCHRVNENKRKLSDDYIKRKNAQARDNHKCRVKKVFLYLLDHPCVDCGETNPVKLQFDHRDPSQKNEGIARLMSKSESKIWEEINKCDVRCANCHAIRTAQQFNWYMYQLWNENQK